MMKKYAPLLFPFIAALFATFVLPLAFPAVRFLSFAPLITLVLARMSFVTSLWIAFFSGLIIDLFSSSLPLGFFALNYCLTTTLIYRYRNLFDEESIHVFALYTTFFSFVATFLHFIFYALVHMQLQLRALTLVTDLLLMPIFDGIYALLWIFYPIALWRFATRPSSILQYKSALARLFNYIKEMQWQTN